MNLNEGLSEAQAASVPPRRSRSRRAIFLTWLRKIHLYVGLWGAVFGLLFGVTGLLLNHRAILKIPVEKTVQKTVQVALPSATAFSSPADLSAWLQQELQFKSVAPPIIKSQMRQKVIWADIETVQPERWTVILHRPGGAINAEYFVGNRFVKLDKIDATPIGTLTRLHMSTGVNAFWVLLSDTIAGALILLSITGLLLWTQLHTVRTVAVLTSVGALCSALWFMWSI
ncbi:PepSY-associated TM helix domain-containing protein [Janthinobacterium sp. 17J80-10]|uniref:PepSY-associated TM helix domain-containing protein n=1 Tax=Janthinobacterium sp. 17J80-10 TaxID=2497863 RepID=UPI0010055905|nr:PepSY-associated TM helix domain-containing protein [Janthinobacterium sp. 17J80-10]QAU35068.1 peptidase [Janthinobacterium sp. 17J80-10]